MDLPTICDTLKETATAVCARIVDRWNDIALAEPWLKLPEELDLDHLPDLVVALADASLCTEYRRDLCQKVVALAAHHGTHRAQQGFGENLIYREYHLLTRALDQTMQDEHGRTADIFYASMRIDVMMSLAGSAALHGLHRSELESEGRWPQVLDELLESWPLPEG